LRAFFYWAPPDPVGAPHIKKPPVFSPPLNRLHLLPLGLDSLQQRLGGEFTAEGFGKDGLGEVVDRCLGIFVPLFDLVGKSEEPACIVFTVFYAYLVGYAYVCRSHRHPVD
jgi:hypothetical protein